MRHVPRSPPPARFSPAPPSAPQHGCLAPCRPAARFPSPPTLFHFAAPGLANFCRVPCPSVGPPNDHDSTCVLGRKRVRDRDPLSPVDRSGPPRGPLVNTLADALPAGAQLRQRVARLFPRLLLALRRRGVPGGASPRQGFARQRASRAPRRRRAGPWLRGLVAPRRALLCAAPSDKRFPQCVARVVDAKAALTTKLNDSPKNAVPLCHISRRLDDDWFLFPLLPLTLNAQ